MHKIIYNRETAAREHTNTHAHTHTLDRILVAGYRLCGAIRVIAAINTYRTHVQTRADSLGPGLASMISVRACDQTRLSAFVGPRGYFVCFSFAKYYVYVLCR